MPRSNVVITGMGVVSSIGIGCDSYFQSLLAGNSGIVSLRDRTDEGAKPGAEAEPAGLWIGGPIRDFDAKQYVRPRKSLKVMCREIQTAFAAAQMAVESSALEEDLPADGPGRMLPSQVGTVFGSEMFYGPPEEMEDTVRACLEQGVQFDVSRFGAAAMKQIIPLWMLKYLPNMPACHVGIALNAQGPNNTIVMGDISGPSAVIEGVGYLQRGIAELLIAGATGTRISTTRMNYRGDLPIADVADPIAHSSRPHDPSSKGVVGGEGAAALVLESTDHARRRGVAPIARITAFASRFVAADCMRRSTRSSLANDPGARGSAQAIRLAIEAALADAEISSRDLGMVVSHATGDPTMDAAEREAVLETVPHVPMVATVASLGHTGAACGMIDLVTGVLALTKGVVPPTLNADSIRTDMNLLRSAETMSGNHVLCLTYNPEGNATAVVLSKV